MSALVPVECFHCRKSFVKYRSHIAKRTFCSRACVDLGLPRPVGKNHPMWKGGTSQPPACQICGHQTGDRVSKRCRSCYIKTWADQTIHPRWNGGKPICKDCGIQINYGLSPRRCRDCNDKYRTGPNNPFWKGGISKFPYPIEFNKRLKHVVKTRDGFHCGICGIPEHAYKQRTGKVLAVHHVNYKKNDCRLVNLLTTCNPCNSRMNANRSYWKIYCRKLVKEVS